MKPTPLLDMWQKPTGAGDPIGVLATTFTLDPDFFERHCLARFLALESVDEGSGSAEDLVARLELEESLRGPTITVLADRSALGERSSLRWDLLGCHVPTGLLHAKVAILLWANATRIIIGSANLTPAGYRRNIEIALAADVGENCVLPREVLDGLADELESYLDLVPGLAPNVPARDKATRLLELFRAEITTHRSRNTNGAVTLAPSNATMAPLDALSQVWRGPRPLLATHVSPFWDIDNPSVLKAVSALLTGRPAVDRLHRVAVTLGPDGTIAFPSAFHKDGLVDTVVQLGPIDREVRPLHAKCLTIQSNQWIAVLVGSSNHTVAGLGLGGTRRHRELNVWLGASLNTEEGRALRDLIPCGTPIDTRVAQDLQIDEDEPEELVTLPPFFQLCRLSKHEGTWSLRLGFDALPPSDDWHVALPDHTMVIDAHAWRASGTPSTFVQTLSAENLPMFLEVRWYAGQATWPVVADNRHDLPPGPTIADLQAPQLLEALASGKTLIQVLRERIGNDTKVVQPTADAGIVTDPLKRFDSRSTLLRRGRALAAALTALERRLGRPLTTLDALEARLNGPLGPRFIAEKIVMDYLQGAIPGAEALFVLAEIALSVARVDWANTLPGTERNTGLALVEAMLVALAELRTRVGNEPTDVARYAAHAIREAKRCLVS